MLARTADPSRGPDLSMSLGAQGGAPQYSCSPTSPQALSRCHPGFTGVGGSPCTTDAPVTLLQVWPCHPLTEPWTAPHIVSEANFANSSVSKPMSRVRLTAIIIVKALSFFFGRMASSIAP